MSGFPITLSEEQIYQLVDDTLRYISYYGTELSEAILTSLGVSIDNEYIDKDSSMYRGIFSNDDNFIDKEAEQQFMLAMLDRLSQERNPQGKYLMSFREGDRFPTEQAFLEHLNAEIDRVRTTRLRP